MSRLNEAGSSENHAQITSFTNDDNIISSRQQRIYDETAGIQSKHTRITYQYNFNRFLNKIKIHDRQVLLDFSPKVIKEMIIDYIHYLSEERKMRRDSIKTQIAPIIRFFKINNDDFNLRMDNFKLHLPPDELVEEDRPYTTEEIAQVIGVCDPRVKAVVLLMASTGIRLGALPLLRICDLTELGWGDGQKLYKIQVYARTRDKYLALCTPECAKAIDEYLDYRKRSGERLKDEAPLIREQFNVDDSLRIQYPKFVTLKAIEYLLLCNLKKSGARRLGKVHMSHGFRKHHMTTCERSGMRSINVKVLLGHDIGVSGHYYRPSEADLLEDYMSHACDALTIDPTKRLQQKVKDLEGQQTEEIERLRAQLQMYKQEQARAQDTSMESIRELQRRLDATEDRYDKAIMVNDYTQKFLLVNKEKEEKELEEMSPRFRKMYLDWQKTSDYGRKESLIDYYARKRQTAAAEG